MYALAFTIFVFQQIKSPAKHVISENHLLLKAIWNQKFRQSQKSYSKSMQTLQRTQTELLRININ